MKQFPTKKARQEFYEEEGIKNCQQKLYGNPSDWIHHKIKNLSLGLLKNVLKDKTKIKVLDIGCAEGLFLRKMSHLISKGIGVDIAGNKIKRAKKLNQRFHNLYFFTKDFLDWEQNTHFGLIFSIEALEHIPYIKKLLKKINFLLENKGTFICSIPTDKEMIFYQPSADWKKISGHLYNWSRKDFCQLLERANFKIIKSYGINNIATQIMSRTMIFIFKRYKREKANINKSKIKKKSFLLYKSGFNLTIGARFFSRLDNVFNSLPLFKNYNNYNIFICKKK